MCAIVCSESEHVHLAPGGMVSSLGICCVGLGWKRRHCAVKLKRCWRFARNVAADPVVCIEQYSGRWWKARRHQLFPSTTTTTCLNEYAPIRPPRQHYSRVHTHMNSSGARMRPQPESSQQAAKAITTALFPYIVWIYKHSMLEHTTTTTVVPFFRTHSTCFCFGFCVCAAGNEAAGTGD